MDKENLYFKYTKGQERSEVIERDNYTSSIFAEQYSQALRLINSSIESYQDGACQIIAFCGDRGEGKSSCLKTIHEILKSVNEESSLIKPKMVEQEEGNHMTNYLATLDVKSLQESIFEVLDIIDPAFFDKGHNVQELVVGQMYTNFRELYKDKTIDRIQLNDVLKQFEKVKLCVTTLKKAENGDINEYDELETLAYSMTLKDHINRLIESYLKIIGKEGGKLVITVDDIDLNMEEAYRMCEQIRKYFSNQHTIILLAVKIDQLHQAVARALKKSSQPNNELTQSANIMAEKYLAKFLPAYARINMPNIFDICGRYLQIGDKRYETHTVMDTILELIFQRTRFLFYNSMGVVSPLIPTNLRGFLQLLGLLNEMHDLEKYNNDKSNKEFKRKLAENKHTFKNYFFIEWLRKLPQDENRERIIELINLADYTLFNKKVCGILSEVKAAIEKRSYHNEDEDDELDEENLPSANDNPMEDVNRIMNTENFAYNVTIGDVFYIIHLLEKVDLSIEQQNLLFFIKSLYSIRLYEAYDSVTEIQEDHYSNVEALHAGIYRYDSRLTDTNELQRLVGGSYFSYPTGSLMKASKEHNQAIDCCILNTSMGINELCDKAKRIKPEMWDEYFEDVNTEGLSREDYLQFLLMHQNTTQLMEKGPEGIELIRNIRAFRIMEFFALTVCQTITQKELDRERPDKLKGIYRSNVIPAFLNKFGKTSKRYLIFDVLSPFSNLVNVKFTYSRWGEYITDFYNTAIKSPWSLLRKMIGYAILSRYGEDCYNEYCQKKFLTESEQKDYLHLLQSDSIIRNGEVLAAMFENINTHKALNKDAASFYNLPSFYSNIASSNMSTYSVTSDGKNGYPISFSFLKAIEETIDDSHSDAEIETVLYSVFHKVPSPKNKQESELISSSNAGSREAKLLKKLYFIMGDKSMTGVEIRAELSKKNSMFASLSASEKLTYIRTRTGEKIDKFELFSNIVSRRQKMEKWCTLFGI